MRYSFYLCVVFVLCSSCFLINKNQGDHLSKLVGNWKVNLEGNHYYISFGRDSILEMYAEYPGPSMVLQLTSLNNTHFEAVDLNIKNAGLNAEFKGQGLSSVLTEKYTAPETLKYEYLIDNDELILTDLKNDFTVRAINCRADFCDLQRKYFRHSGVDIDLPHSGKGLTIKENEMDYSVYFGQPVGPFQDVYGTDGRFWISGRMGTLADVTLEALAQKRKQKTSLRILLFVDQNTRFEITQNIVLELYRNGLQNIYFAVRTNEDISQTLEINLIKIVEVEMTKTVSEGMTLKDWLLSQ